MRAVPCSAGYRSSRLARLARLRVDPRDVLKARSLL
ncbi:hypothetical protein SAJA_13590 [Salinisphaera japonica YTM-1]|uniref:Uncharacterized protein n=1 Tax=Salinisphaera japonica YTM-1 TaxID=1209778 RepID=A0A423PGZ1_9GAMM|nr:hypothetical protein SAJA_13590 [Salinisphaera japonica YTM-1]